MVHIQLSAAALPAPATIDVSTVRSYAQLLTRIASAAQSMVAAQPPHPRPAPHAAPRVDPSDLRVLTGASPASMRDVQPQRAHALRDVLQAPCVAVLVTRLR